MTEKEDPKIEDLKEEPKSDDVKGGKKWRSTLNPSNRVDGPGMRIGKQEPDITE